MNRGYIGKIIFIWIFQNNRILASYGRWEALDRPKMMAYGPLRLLEPGQLILGTFIFDVFWRHMGSIWEATLAVGGKSWSRMPLGPSDPSSKSRDQVPALFVPAQPTDSITGLFKTCAGPWLKRKAIID